ncbi:hypothetical protein [Nostoc sphaeroides]|uniref:Uncharacterized protein n=1 Tax=Nostoc sphaeroides CCNUC1 TaxID=2653204 RepID=A0A5P8VRD4_9NOSO|nr:hypothetical protein [Nostoc sphaeroides]MCC5627928.1 hypothetical protein [Nostoc sphaeroides CHAB 2801]QFS42975.1 hypothetical protein GXM_00448 [Nostoc sphaeroides CCNUC1]
METLETTYNGNKAAPKTEDKPKNSKQKRHLPVRATEEAVRGIKPNCDRAFGRNAIALSIPTLQWTSKKYHIIMAIKNITYQRVLNLGNYESKRLELSEEVFEGDDVEESISRVMEMVERKIREDAAIKFEQEIRQRKKELRELVLGFGLSAHG